MMNIQKELKSFPLPLFAEVLNPRAKTFRPPTKVRPVVPKFTEEQMTRARMIQLQELETMEEDPTLRQEYDD